MSTIHGFCARLLRENAIAAGLAPDFSVLDQAPSDRMARAAAEESMESLLSGASRRNAAVADALDLSTQDDGRQPDLARSLLDVYEAMRLAGLRELPPSESDPDAFEQARSWRARFWHDPARGNAPSTEDRRTRNCVSGRARFSTCPDGAQWTAISTRASSP